MQYTKTLKRNTDFRRLYYRGKSRPSRNVVVYAAKRKGKTARIGITTSKKLGCAVVRNRIRRIILAAYRQIEQELDLRGYDFVFVARAGAAHKKSTDLYREMKKILKVYAKP